MMSNLSAFLKPAAPVEQENIVISKRFRNEDGSIAPFIIRPIPQEENDRLIRQATRRTKVNGRSSWTTPNMDAVWWWPPR